MRKRDVQITTIKVDAFCMLRLNAHWLSWKDFTPGDKVRVIVQRMKQPKEKS